MFGCFKRWFLFFCDPIYFTYPYINYYIKTTHRRMIKRLIWFVWCCYTLCLWPLQVVLVFPSPGAVSVQDMMQYLHDQTDRKSYYTSDEPNIKRLKRMEDRGTPHTAEYPESGTPGEAKGSESRAFPLQRVVFIDSTWNQTNKISTDERLQGNHECLHFCSFQTAFTAGDYWGQKFWVHSAFPHAFWQTCALP